MDALLTILDENGWWILSVMFHEKAWLYRTKEK